MTFEEKILKAKDWKKENKSLDDILRSLKKLELQINEVTAIVAELENIKISQARSIVFDSKIWDSDREKLQNDTDDFFNNI